MDVIGTADPWVHHSVKRFIPEEDFPILKEKVSSWPKTPEDKRRISMFICRDDQLPTQIERKDEEVKYIPDNWVYELLERRFRILVDQTIDDYNIDLDETLMVFEYISCPAGYEHAMHVDACEKFCSMVLYVSDEGDGTNIYKPNKEYHSTIEWVPNNGLFFYRGNYTWHSYGSTVNHRDTINCILLDKKQNIANIRYDLDV
jgi:hypothetical protein